MRGVQAIIAVLYSPIITMTGPMMFFGPQMALPYRLDAILQDPKNSQFPEP